MTKRVKLQLVAGSDNVSDIKFRFTDCDRQRLNK